VIIVPRLVLARLPAEAAGMGTAIDAMRELVLIMRRFPITITEVFVGDVKASLKRCRRQPFEVRVGTRHSRMEKIIAVLRRQPPQNLSPMAPRQTALADSRASPGDEFGRHHLDFFALVPLFGKSG
jgi:hypothetical protein